MRHLAGRELIGALAAELVEEAQATADAVANRSELLNELADIAEVIAALRNACGIEECEIAGASIARAQRLGRFESGARLVSLVPEAVRPYTISDVVAQRVKWIPERWTDVFDLFLMALTWVYKTKDYGPSRARRILNEDGAGEKIADIVATVRRDGTEARWRALLSTHKIPGLNMSFGTELLDFAGHTTESPSPFYTRRTSPRLLATASRGGPVPSRGMARQADADYMRYSNWPSSGQANPLWQQAPDVVEYALFDR